MTGAPSGSVEEFATVRVLAFCGPVLACVSPEGVSDGNRAAALPPGLSAGLALGRSGRLPTDSGEVLVTGRGEPAAPAAPVAPAEAAELAGTAVTVVVTDACGSLDRSVALPAAVSRTDVTVVAEAGTVTFACSWRWAELASSAPRSHDAVPSLLPQPKLNAGLRLAGAADNRMVASATLPPVAQAVTVHRAA